MQPRAVCRRTLTLLPIIVLGLLVPRATAEVPAVWTKLGDRPGDKMLGEYFRAETARLRDTCLADVKTLDDWKARRASLHKQLLEIPMQPVPLIRNNPVCTTSNAKYVVYSLRRSRRLKMRIGNT